MANPYVNKVVINGETKLDLSGDTITADKLAEGYTAHDASGAPITGTMTGGGFDETEYSKVLSSNKSTTITFTGLQGEPREWRVVCPSSVTVNDYTTDYILGGAKTPNGGVLFHAKGSWSNMSYKSSEVTTTYSNGSLTINAVSSSVYWINGTSYTLYYKL